MDAIVTSDAANFNWVKPFAPEALKRGRKLLLLCGVEQGAIEGKWLVRDPVDEAEYVVEVDDRQIIDYPQGYCSCAARMHCSHAAAVLLFLEEAAKKEASLPEYAPDPDLFRLADGAFLGIELVRSDRRMCWEMVAYQPGDNVKLKFGKRDLPPPLQDLFKDVLVSQGHGYGYGYRDFNPYQYHSATASLGGFRWAREILFLRKLVSLGCAFFYKKTRLQLDGETIELTMHPWVGGTSRNRICLPGDAMLIDDAARLYLSPSKGQIGAISRLGSDDFWISFCGCSETRIAEALDHKRNLLRNYPRQWVEFAMASDIPLAYYSYSEAETPRFYLASSEGEILPTDAQVKFDQYAPLRKFSTDDIGRYIELKSIQSGYDYNLLNSRRVWMEGCLVSSGPKITPEPSWELRDGKYHFDLGVPGFKYLFGSLNTYFSTKSGCLHSFPKHVGPMLLEVMKCSPIEPDEINDVRDKLLKLRVVRALLPDPQPIDLRVKPTARIELTTNRSNQPVLRVFFHYGPIAHYVANKKETILAVSKGESRLYRVFRDLEYENQVMGRLEGLGFTAERRLGSWLVYSVSAEELAPLWNQKLQPLRDMGCKITTSQEIGLLGLEVRDVSLSMTPHRGGYRVNCMVTTSTGEVDAVPYLARYITGSQTLVELISEIEKRQTPVELPGDEGQPTLTLPIEKIRSILMLFAEMVANGGKPTGNIPLLHALDFAVNEKKSWECPEGLLRLALNLEKPEVVPPPAGLMANLRHYQDTGFQWLRFWREAGLNGILADDMGLGKTVQTIALLLHEKEQGRADLPTLIVVPTSLLSNWKSELERFAPSLTVGVWHKEGNGKLAEHASKDVILTTYTMAYKRADRLSALRYHYIILDEAQSIKNRQTLARQALIYFESRHRLCLTGTPIENHLGELWSLLDFLNPGLMHNYEKFTSFFREPIEGEGNQCRKLMLARRVRSVIVRRTKAEVEPDLPEKTEIVERVALLPEQEALYESLRLACVKEVQDVVEEQGFNTGRFRILSVLLKLRQVCCDPRLLKEDLSRVPGSGKREALMALLSTMIEDGRHVLIFSQFTEMLDLLGQELKQAGVRFVRLDGSTQDRETPVASFQAGEVSVFLLSLKAGGVGLNLTAADTVILYDPWWNPAVEAQAIDRTHRIGQTQKVFAYRMVAAGTIEERILLLQDKKRELAASILDEAKGGESPALTAQDIDYLLAPLKDE